jgi:hypothetical protein
VCAVVQSLVVRSRICVDETDSCATILFRVIDCVLRIMFTYTLVIYMTRQILVV